MEIVMETKTTYKINSLKEERFAELLEKINKKARKLGLPELTTKEVSREHVPMRVKDQTNPGHPAYDIIELEIDGDAPYITGWKLIATLEHSVCGTIIRTVPGEKLPEIYWNASNTCEHCGYNRNRKSTIIIQEIETGTFKQIGTKCITDFLPGLNGERIAQMCSFWGTTFSTLGDEDWDVGCSCSYSLDHNSTQLVLECAAALIRKDGYHKRDNFGNASTGDNVGRLIFGLIYGCNTTLEEKWVNEKTPIETDKKLAEKVMEWIKNRVGDSEYIHNLKQYVETGVTNRRGYGMVASAIVGYSKEVETLEIYKNLKKLNEYVAEKGTKLKDIKVVVRNVRQFESNYGTTTMIAMDDTEGRRLVWFASGDKEVGIDDKLIIDGTVKKLEEYKERKQTILTRCKYEIVENEAE